MIETGFLVLQSLLLGSMIFFAVIVAPSVFHFVPEREAGVFLRGMFPRYYLWGMVLSLIITLMAIFISPLMLVTGSLILAMFVIARQFLMPAINRSRDLAKQGDETAKAKFNALHRFSVMINASQMLILLATIIYLL